MAAPITWRNVDGGPNPASAAIPLAYSQQSINGAFDAFNNILRQREAVNQTNAAAVGEGNKQAYLDRLSQAKTPEELAAMQRSGLLDTLRQGLSPTAAAAVRGADEARLTALRQQATAATAFDEQQRALAERPLRDAIASKVANNDFDGAISDVQSSSIIDKAPLLDGINKARRNLQLQVQGDADADARRKLAESQATLTNLNVTDAQRKADEATESRRIDGIVNNFASNHHQTVTNMRSAVQGEAAKLFGPVDISLLNPAQRQQLDAHLTQTGLPTLADVTTGDTQARQALLATLRDSGIKQNDLTRVEAQLPSILNTSSGLPIGNDAVNVAQATAQNTVGFDREDANNWYAPNSPDARKSYADLATKLPDIVKNSTNGLDPAEDVPDIQALLGELATVGIKTKDGKYVVPSANDVLRFVLSSEGGWFRDAKRAENIREKLSDYVNSSQAQEMIKKGEESQRFRDTQRVKELQREYLYPTKK